MPLDAKSPDIDYLIQTPELREKLSGYLKQTFAEENLHFLEAVNDLQKAAATPGKEAEVRNKAKAIQDEFIKEGADQQVNLDGPTRIKLESLNTDDVELSPEQLVDAMRPATQEINRLVTDHTRSWLTNNPQIGEQIAAERAKHQEVAPQNWTKTKPTIRDQLKIGSHRASQEQKLAPERPSVGGHRSSGVK